MRAIIIVLSALLISACGSGGGDAGASSQKSFWGQWQSVSSGLRLDLTGGDFGSPQPFYVRSSSELLCTCSAVASGTETSGTYTISSCAYNMAATAPDPGCASLNSSGTYSRSGSYLRFCDPGCVDYY